MSLFSAAVLAASALSQAAPAGPLDLKATLKADTVVRLGTGTDRSQAVLADVSLGLEAEHITEAGWRLGAAASLRAQNDSARRGFARRAGDCPPARAGCPSTQGRGLAGALTGLHAVAGPDADTARGEVEAAYLFVKAPRFEVRLGRGPGAAAIEAEPLPGAFRLMRADAGLVDPEGLSLASTANTLSTNSAKIVVQSRRLIGFRASASYTPQAQSCGVDVCRPETGAAGPVFAEVENVLEGALSFDHRFRASGQRWTASLTASAGEAAGPFAARFEDPWVASARVIWSRGPLSAGLGALVSNDGVEDGDYRALSASLAWERGPWLTALEWAGGDSDLVHAQGWTLQLGSSRLFENGAVAGIGLRHGEETVPAVHGAQRVSDTGSASTLFVEAGLRF